MENIFSIVINIIFISLSVLIVCGILLRVLKDKFSAEVSAKARVTDKASFDQRTMSHFEAPKLAKKYVVTFDIEGKKKRFYVSELSFKMYQKGQKGVLKYKGSKIIDFSKESV